ncbi:MAG: hypothetical protein FJ147_15130 [Deltaproteobacteria bacterium]|nr:hypothetical protein [Deltaproteobacteria bacterium]
MNIELNTSQTVQTWLQGVHEQSGSTPEADTKRLQILAEFCAQVEKQPDEIIDDCLRDVDGGGKKIRAKGRRFYADKINEFEQQATGSSGEKRQKANYIRSFLIHNGVLMQTSPLA